MTLDDQWPVRCRSSIQRRRTASHRWWCTPGRRRGSPGRWWTIRKDTGGGFSFWPLVSSLSVLPSKFKCTDNHTSHISYSSWILFSFFFTVLFNILSLTYIICGGWPSHEAGGGSFPWRRSKNSHGNFPVQLFGKISSRLGGRGGGWVVPTGYPPERKVSVTGFFDLAAYRADQARQQGMM